MEKLITQRLKESLDFFGDLKIEEQERLVQSITIKSYKKNQLVMAHSCDSICIYIVKKGSLRAIVESESGKTVTLKKYDKTNNVIIAIGREYLDFEVEVDYIVDEDCEIAMMSSFFINLLFNNNLAVKDYVIKNSVALLRGAIQALQQITNRDIAGKVSAWLLHQFENNVNSNKIIATHEKIAQEIGSVREVVSRNLKKLQERGMIELYRGSIAIISKEKLEETI